MWPATLFGCAAAIDIGQQNTAIDRRDLNNKNIHLVTDAKPHAIVASGHLHAAVGQHIVIIRQGPDGQKPVSHAILQRDERAGPGQPCNNPGHHIAGFAGKQGRCKTVNCPAFRTRSATFSLRDMRATFCQTCKVAIPDLPA